MLQSAYKHYVILEVKVVDINILWVADHIALTTEAHSHEFYHLIFCKKKGGKINVDNDVYTAKSDYVYLVKPKGSSLNDRRQ